MMVTFDTQYAVDSLSSLGFTKKQASGITEVLRQTQASSTENLATKNDVKLLGAELRTEMAELKSELKAEIDAVNARLGAQIIGLDAKVTSLQNELIIKLGGIMAVGIGILAAMITFM